MPQGQQPSSLKHHGHPHSCSPFHPHRSSPFKAQVVASNGVGERSARSPSTAPLPSTQHLGAALPGRRCQRVATRPM